MKDLNLSGWNQKMQLVATVAYFDVFEMALSLEDLARLKLGERLAVVDWENLASGDGNFFQIIKGRVVLRDRETLVEKSLWQEKLVRAFLNDARVWSRWYRWVPFVDGVAVCNYLPLGTVDEHSDIDLFVITRENRIFTARLLLTIVTHLLGKRRHGKKVEGRHCLSFYASEKDLNFEELLLDKNDIYFAYWLLALLPIFGEKKLWQRLFDENGVWGKKFFPDWPARFNTPDAIFESSWWRKSLEYLLKGKFGDILENFLAKYFQKRHASRKAFLPENASVVVNNRWLKYHNNDRRQYFRKEWLDRLKRLGIFS